jgi:uncharacterized protein with FMN-binding domain
MRKLLVSMGAIAVVLLVIVGLFIARYHAMASRVESAGRQVEPVDLSTVPDGTYEGEFGEFLVSVRLEVTVRDHRITDITIVEQRCGEGYEATETVDRILEAQSPKVDAVTGATGSSMTIMIAAYRALTQR